MSSENSRNPEASLDHYTFHIDVVSPERIEGWVVNQLDRTLTASVEVRSGDQLLWQAEANQPREDLNATGLGDSAFVIIPDATALQSDISEVELYIDGHKVQAEAFPFVMEALKLPPSACYIDSVTDELVVGWAWNEGVHDHRVTVELVADGVVVGAARAEEFRQDVKDAGMGDGYYGFTIPYDLARFPAETIQCQVFVDGQATPLEPIELSAPAEAISKAKFKAHFSEQIATFEQMLATENQRIAAQIEALTPENEQASLNVVGNVAISNIAEISARVAVIERILTTHIAK